ncbi:hypothetical protein BH09BAC1_BH09BAC1_30170 [soil metagenome]
MVRATIKMEFRYPSKFYPINNNLVAMVHRPLSIVHRLLHSKPKTATFVPLPFGMVAIFIPAKNYMRCQL